jgi:hypothetical protein
VCMIVGMFCCVALAKNSTGELYSCSDVVIK